MESKDFLHKVLAAIPGGERTTSSDFSISTNANSFSEIQRLAFLDSRGKKIAPEENEGFLAALLAEEWASKNEKYLVITRTHASTTVFTLINFLKNIGSKVPYLLTNVGFVDFTPKKKEVIEDILFQAAHNFDVSQLKTVELESYTLSSGVEERLVIVDIAPLTKAIGKILADLCHEVVLLGTPEFSERVVFARQRPSSFYTQLPQTNEFLRRLASSTNLPITFVPVVLEGEILESLFDGVHFTPAGHNRLFHLLQTKGLI